jgi:hypothetical protein
MKPDMALKEVSMRIWAGLDLNQRSADTYWTGSPILDLPGLSYRPKVW